MRKGNKTLKEYQEELNDLEYDYHYKYLPAQGFPEGFTEEEIKAEEKLMIQEKKDFEIIRRIRTECVAVYGKRVLWPFKQAPSLKVYNALSGNYDPRYLKWRSSSSNKIE